MYVLDVIRYRFYFREVQKEILGQCIREEISTPKMKGLSVYQLFVTEKNKQVCRGDTCINNTLKFWRLSWKFSRKRSAELVQLHENVLHSLRIPRPTKRNPGYSMWFLLVTPKNSTFFLIHSWKFHMLQLPPAGTSMS